MLVPTLRCSYRSITPVLRSSSSSALLTTPAEKKLWWVSPPGTSAPLNPSLVL